MATLRRGSGVWSSTRIRAPPKTWHSLAIRRYAVDSTAEPEWLQPLRTEMLNRDTSFLQEKIVTEPGNRLASTLSGFLPPEWCCPPTVQDPVLTPGYHLIWFNPALPTDRMLPDGTDALHSPGDPWVRRMWAGGSVMFEPYRYYHAKNGFAVNSPMAGMERIVHVRLRGQGDAAKLFVTIERRFGRMDFLYKGNKRKHGHGSLENTEPSTPETYFKQQFFESDPWGDAMLKEKRELVFLQKRSATELEAINAGQMAPIKYLDPPGIPQISHTLTPTRSLLFRFSALTFNAHLIHLDPGHARSVEGHRNILVHGPLSLIFMLQTIHNHLKSNGQKLEIVEQIDYRNLAPLYCDEQIRICASEKHKTDTGSTYNVWIEGPTGGVAVKGTVRTVVRPADRHVTDKQENSRRGELSKGQSSDERKPTSKPVRRTSHAKASFTSEPQSSRTYLLRSPKVHDPLDKQRTYTYTSKTIPNPRAPPSSGRILPFSGRTRVRAHKFFEPMPPIRRVYVSPPLKPYISPTTRYLMRRLVDRDPRQIHGRPKVLWRAYKGKAYKPDALALSRKKNYFREHGVRRFVKWVVRKVGQKLGAK